MARRARRTAPLAEDDRVTRRGLDRCVEADLRERVTQPLRSAADVGGVLGASAHARDPQQVEQLIVDASIVLVEVLVQVGHRESGIGNWGIGNRESTFAV